MGPNYCSCSSSSKLFVQFKFPGITYTVITMGCGPSMMDFTAEMIYPIRSGRSLSTPPSSLSSCSSVKGGPASSEEDYLTKAPSKTGCAHRLSLQPYWMCSPINHIVDVTEPHVSCSYKFL